MRLIPPSTTLSAVPTPTTTTPTPAPTVTPTPTSGVIIVAIASSAPDRVLVAASVGENLPLLMVSSVEEALALLSGATPNGRPVQGFDAVDAVEITESVPAGPRRLSPSLEEPDLEIDSDDRVLRCGERSIDLTPLEHDVMACLLPNIGRTWPYGALNRRVWGSDHQGGRGNVHSVVKRLRHKLDLLDSPLHLDVVRGVGLRLVPARRHA